MRDEEITEEENEYMDYLDEVFEAPDYGFLMYQGDPIAFNVGKNEYFLEKK